MTTKPRLFFISIVFIFLFCWISIDQKARADDWDNVITNTNWYVPTDQLLAYVSPRTSFSNPIAVGDQTLWSLGTSTNGVFTGTSASQLGLGPVVSSSNTTIQGWVTPDGHITMLFTPVGGGTATVGLGEMRYVDGIAQMEMQMISGTSMLVTHWAYMIPYNPATFTPPAPQPVFASSSPQWAWTAGTPWKIVSPKMFGTNAPGHFIITDYKNGYFFGRGVGPTGNSTSDYTILGSITPEGKVLFNTLSKAQLTSLYGDITGDGSTAIMILRGYDAYGVPTGLPAYISVIAPYSQTVKQMDNPAAMGAAEVLYDVAGTDVGLDGTMSPAINFLNNSSGAQLSGAISQTLPVLGGNSAKATYDAQRGLMQMVTTRRDGLPGAGMSEVMVGPDHIWFKPLGSVISQSSLDGIVGYDTVGGGLAAGIDTAISEEFRLGGMFAYSYNSMTSSDDHIPNTLNVNSYQIGTYGTYALGPDLNLDFQIDAALNQSSERRSITFMDTAASADYNGYTVHAGTGIKKDVPIGVRTLLSFLLHLDYGRYQGESYSETGAGALNLNVDSQTYQELRLTAGIQGSYQLSDNISFAAHAGVGNNLLNNQPSITASYEGGGDHFSVQGIDSSPWLYTAGVSFNGIQKGNFGVSLRYDVQVNSSGFLSQVASLVFVMQI